MVAFKKYQGKYSEVLQTLKYPSSFSESHTSEDYLHLLEKDLPRMCYLSFNQNVESIKAHFRENSTDNSYSQGMLFGSFFTEIINQPLKVATINFTMTNDQPHVGISDSVAFTYTDDEGRHCGLSINYVRDDNDLSIELDQRPRHYTVAVIRNVEKPPAERDVIILSHPKLLAPFAEFQANNAKPVIEGVHQTIEQKKRMEKDILNAGKNTSSQQVAQEVTQATHSRTINALIAGIIQGKTIDLEKFSALKTRLTAGKNIDDRDEKLNKLVEIMMHHRSSAFAPQIREKLELMIINSIYDVHYFKDISLEQLETLKDANPLRNPIFRNLRTIDELKRQAINECKILAFENKGKQSFLSRNVNHTLMLAGFILSAAVVATALTATGGILALAGSALIGVALAIASSAVAANMIFQEQRLSAYQKELNVLEKKIQAESTPMKADCDKALRIFDKGLTDAIAAKAAAKELEELDELEMEPARHDGAAPPRAPASGAAFFNRTPSPATDSVEPPSPNQALS